jgi:pilus assembly protein Flp/PilA
MRGTFIKRLLRDNRGATAIEYGLIVSLVVIACIVALQGVADSNTGLWATVVQRVTAVM